MSTGSGGGGHGGLGGVRRFHRAVSVAFTLAVTANFVARGVGSGPPPDWVTYAPLPPLALLWLTGLCLFVRPYLRRRAAAPGLPTA
jgi:hypothetical protein